MKCQHAIGHASANPRAALRFALSLARGEYYRLKFMLLRKRVTIGRRFRVCGRLDIRGPGIVIFGDDCTVVSTYLAPVTPYTTAPEAVIRFGDRVVLNGTRFSCRQRIEVGDGSLLADARIMDTDFHALDPQSKHRWQTEGATKPVILGPNVWVAAGTFILKGVTIGTNSIVGAGSVVTRDVPPNCVVAGNPARAVKGLREASIKAD